MGMPMNRFAMLKKLRDDIKSGDYNSRQFKLSAVIVHDPNDRELVRCINRNFEKWAEATGKNFLLVSFVTPSRKWKTSKYLDARYFDVDKDYLMADKFFSREDEEKTISLLRDLVGLSPESSYLMLTDDLSSSRFYKIRITGDTVKECLDRITDYCDEEAAGKEHTGEDFEDLLEKLGAEDCVLSNALIDTLIDVTSIFSKAVDRYSADEQKNWAVQFINKLKDNLEHAEGEEYKDKLSRLCEHVEDMFLKLGLIKGCSMRELRQEYGHNVEYLAEGSKTALKTYYLACIMFDGVYDFEYSVFTQTLGKIVDREMQLSIYQMLRYVIGIDMPRYYNKYCMSMGDVYVPAGDDSINLNRPKNIWKDMAPLKGVTMGNLVYACRDMYRGNTLFFIEPVWERFDKLNREFDIWPLIEFLDEFRRYRNSASHIDNDSAETYEEARVAFSEFMNEYLPELYKLKRWLSDG